MADLEFTADYRQVLEADKAAQRLEKSFNDLVSASKRGAVSQDQLYQTFSRLEKQGLSLSQVYKSMERDEKRAADNAAKLRTAQLELSLANKSAAQSARDIERGLKAQEAETRRAAAAAERLRETYVPLYGASKRYERALDEINKANREGILTDNQRDAALEQLNAQYSQMASQGRGNVRVQNDLGLAVQQTGYQVGDFLVQVQSGTNFMVAFGQQATQLVGVLPLLSNRLGVSAGKLIAISSGLGIAIPLVTAIGAGFMRSSGQGKTFDDLLGELNDSISTLESALDSARSSADDFAERFGSVSNTLRPFVQDLAELQQLTALNKLQEQFESLDIVSKSFMDSLRDALNGNTQGMIRYSKELGLTLEQYADLGLAVRELREAENLQDRINKAAELRNYIRDTVGGTSQMTDRMRAFYENLVQAVIAGGELKGITESSGSAAQVLSDIVGGINFSGAISGAESLYGILRNAAQEAARIARVRTQSEEAGGLQRVFDVEAYGGAQTSMREGLETTRTQGTVLPAPRSSGGSSGGGSIQEDRLGALARSLLLESEQIETWRQESLEKLQEFNQKELEILGGHAEAKRRIEEEYANRIKEIQEQERSVRVNELTGMFSAFAAIAETGGKRMLKIQAVLSGAATMIAAYEAAMKAAAEAKTIPGRIAAYAMFVAKGLQTVQSINAIGSSGNASAGGGGGGGAIATPAAQQAAPQRVLIEGISPDSMISGQMLSDLFDRLYEENDERGLVFQIAR